MKFAGPVEPLELGTKEGYLSLRQINFVDDWTKPAQNVLDSTRIFFRLLGKSRECEVSVVADDDSATAILSRAMLARVEN